MDQSFQFDRDHFLVREPSPFALEQLIQFRRADLFERAAIQRLDVLVKRASVREPEIMDGALMVSAILFGALLDKRLWPAWLARSYGVILDMGANPLHDWRAYPQAALHDEKNEKAAAVAPVFRPYLRCSGRIWIDLWVGDPARRAEPKRWVADPLTHCLLRHWQHARQTPPANPSQPDAAMAAFFGVEHWKPELQSQFAAALLDAATTKWRLRMPGFLIEALGDRGQSVNLPTPRWEAVLGRATPEASFEIAVTKSDGISPHPVLALIQQLLPAGRQSDPRVFRERAAALAEAALQDDISASSSSVLQWAAVRLDPERDKTQRSRGVAPKEILKRASALIYALEDEFGPRDPRTCSTEDWIGYADAMLRGKSAGSKFPSHLRCYLDWLHGREQRQAVAIIPVERRQSGVSTNVITGVEYRRALARFSPLSMRGATARLAIVLGFRAGLRWDEAIGLSVSDLRFTGDTIELTVRSNAIRRLKTPAGRRTLPLHILLEPDEVIELRQWWNQRTSVSRALAPVDATGVHEMRLFPARSELAVKRFEDVLEHTLREVSGDENVKLHTLRHSFGSYLLTTLSLPSDLPDDALQPRLDGDLVSHRRRARIADVLWGQGRLGQNAVHVTSSLLGHSGNSATLRSYTHLTDWLAGIYVARPTAQRGLPTSLVAALLGHTEGAIERADRRRAARAEAGSGSDLMRRPRGRQRADSTALGSIYLSPLLDAFEAQRVPAAVAPIATPPAPDPVPGWRSMLAIITAATDAERAKALDQRDIDSRFGRQVVAHLDVLLTMRTRGRSGNARLRHAVRTPVRRRALRRLTAEQAELLARLYRGSAKLDRQDRTLLVEAFIHGYDGPRGVVRVPLAKLVPLVGIMRAIGCAPDEVTVHQLPNSATMRIGQRNRTGRGFQWAMLMVAAVHLAACSARPT